MARLIEPKRFRMELDELDCIDKFGYVILPITKLDIALERSAVDAVPVVRCKDCRWWDKSEDSPFGYCMAMKHGYMSTNWEIGIYRRYKGDFYCADAERRKR